MRIPSSPCKTERHLRWMHWGRSERGREAPFNVGHPQLERLMNHELFVIVLDSPHLSLDYVESWSRLAVRVGIRRDARFAHGDIEVVHPVNDMLTRSFRYLTFFQHEWELVARTTLATSGWTSGAGGITWADYRYGFSWLIATEVFSGREKVGLSRVVPRP